MSFANLSLNPLVSKALDACGYTQATEVQSRAIPSILEGRDIITSAQTGSGKTAAFVLPTLHHLAQSKSNIKPRALILTPTRELADQILHATSKYGKFLNLKIVSLIGGMPYHQQLKKLARPVDIVVATPGRLLDHMENKKIDLSKIEILILDEADRMFDMGFIDDVKKIAANTPASRQTLLFSATFNDRLFKTTSQLLKDPLRIDLSAKNMTPAHIKNDLYFTDDLRHKYELFFHLLHNKKIYKAIIFSATKVQADKMAHQLQEQGFAAAALHGDMKQNHRTRTVAQLKDNRIQFLVATDVAARGIDIADLSHVINFDLPKCSEDFIHRIGRTGRAGKSGHAISLALFSEKRVVQSIERLMKQTFEISNIPGLEPQQKSEKQQPRTKKTRFSKDSKGSRFARSSDNSRSSKGSKKSRFSSDAEGSRFSKGSKKPRFSSSSDDSHFSKDSNKPRFSKESKGSRDSDDSRFSRDSEGSRFSKGSKKPRFSGSSDDSHFSKDSKKPRFSKDSKGSRDSDDSRFSRDSEGSRFSKGSKKPRFSSSSEDSYFSKDNKKPRFSKDSKGSRFSRDSDDSRFSRDSEGSRFSKNSKKLRFPSSSDDSYFSKDNKKPRLSRDSEGSRFSKESGDFRKKPKSNRDSKVKFEDKKTFSPRTHKKADSFKKSSTSKNFSKTKPASGKNGPANRRRKAI